MDSLKEINGKTIVIIYCLAISILELIGIRICIYQLSNDDITTTFSILIILSIVFDVIKFLFASTINVIVQVSEQFIKDHDDIFKKINLGFGIGMTFPALVMPVLFIIFFEDSEFALYPQFFILYIIGIILYTLLKENIIVFFCIYFKIYLDSPKANKKKGKELENTIEEKEILPIQIDPELKDVPIYLWDYVKMVKNKEIKKN